MNYDIINVLTIHYTPANVIQTHIFKNISRRFLGGKKIAAIHPFKGECNCFCTRSHSEHKHMWMKMYPETAEIRQDDRIWKLIEKI